jgi:mevalonate kinase
MSLTAPTYVGEAHGKVIVTGEHAVVYSHPAVVSGISLSVKITTTVGKAEAPAEFREFYDFALSIFEQSCGVTLPPLSIKVTGSLPLGVGLGGSAAVAAALFRSLDQLQNLNLTDDQILSLVMQTEQFAHGRASGIDPVAVVKGGLLRFQKKGANVKYESLPTAAIQDQSFFLIQSGVPQETTKQMVELVADKLAAQPRLEQVLIDIGQLSFELSQALAAGEFEPEFLNANQRLLVELGVVGEVAQGMVADLVKVGAVAKVTGGGGVIAGSGMILAYHPQITSFEKWLSEQNWDYYPVQLGAG